MRKLCASVFAASALILTGCNGSSGANETPPTDGVVVELSQVAIAVQNQNGDAQVSFEQGQQATIIATLTDNTGGVVTNTTVNFTTSFGQLAQETKLSNSDGQAIITLSNPDGLAGAGTISAPGGFIRGGNIRF